MDVLATGYPSIDHIAKVSHSPTVGETARLLSVPDTFTFGGCGANIAVGLARLGFRAGMAMVLGDDTYGGDYLRYLAGLGVDTANCICLPGEQTSHSYLFLNQDGQYQNFFFPGAADAWQGELTLQGLDRYRFALVSVGLFDYNRQYVRLAQRAGVPVVWNMKADVFSYPAEMLGDFLSASTYVLMNHIEADYVLQALQRESVDQLLGDTTHGIVITRGELGAQVCTATGTVAIPAVPPIEIVDPTGAGDAFTAGFLAGLLRQAMPEDSARLGAVLASFVIEATGCQTNLPTWGQAMERYQKHFGFFGRGHD
jgi:sugar/nucleoside kinase (ribokinase family)